jgi:tRNA (guanine-N7-)-methyltransferase
MGRRALSRNIKRIPPSPEALEKYLRLWIQEEVHFHPERFPKLTSQALFGNERPLELEVGCGTGEVLCSLASENPEVNFIGIDPVTKVLFYAARMAETMELENLRLVRAPMQVLYPLLVEDSLRAIYVHYPDPFVRSRGQHKVLNPQFFKAVQRALATDGILSVVSDKDALFQEAMRLVEQQPGLERAPQARSAPNVKSRYQLKWERYQLPALRFEVRKAAVSPSDTSMRL